MRKILGYPDLICKRLMYLSSFPKSMFFRNAMAKNTFIALKVQFRLEAKANKIINARETRAYA